MGVRFIWKRPTDGLHEGEEGGGPFQGLLVGKGDAIVVAVDGFEFVEGLLGELHTLVWYGRGRRGQLGRFSGRGDGGFVSKPSSPINLVGT